MEINGGKNDAAAEEEKERAELDRVRRGDVGGGRGCSRRLPFARGSADHTRRASFADGSASPPPSAYTFSHCFAVSPVLFAA